MYCLYTVQVPPITGGETLSTCSKCAPLKQICNIDLNSERLQQSFHETILKNSNFEPFKNNVKL